MRSSRNPPLDQSDDVLVLRLYYPNKWRMYIGDLVEPEDKIFCWFLCSARFKDPETGEYVVEISRGIKFYEEKTGHTYSLPDGGVQPKLLILEDFSGSDPEKFARKNGYQGTATKQGKCELNNPDDFFLCYEAIFYFFPGYLEVSKKEEKCDVVKFSKERNADIRKFVPDFPTTEEIQSLFQQGNSESTAKSCRKLHSGLITYDRSRR